MKIDLLKVVKDNNITLYKKKTNQEKYHSKDYLYCDKDYRTLKKGETPDLDCVLYSEWSTGGMSGGNCWDDSGPRGYSSDEPEPEFTELDLILEKCIPNITYLQYKKLATKIDFSSYTKDEYYGNCVNYSVKTIRLKDIQDFANLLRKLSI